MRITGISGPVPALGGARVFVCKSKGDKRPTSGGMAPTEHWCVAKGFTPGVELWIDEYVDAHGDFLVEAISARSKGRIDLARSRSNRGATSKEFCHILRHFAADPHLGLDTAKCQSVGISARGARHMFPGLRMTLQIAEVKAGVGEFALGHWRLPDLRRPTSAARIAMPTGYAGSEPQLLAAASTRISVIDAVRAWIGACPWRSVVPGGDGHASFSFLLTPHEPVGEQGAP